MSKLLAFAVAMLCIAGSPAARACGFCIEDKVAATYDHAVITRAVERGHEIVFLEVMSAEPIKPAQRRFIVRTVESISGVGRGSVRTSVIPQALSFELDASRSIPAAVLAKINERLRKQQVSVGLIRILNQRQGTASR
jgi:hypothetical protein